MNTNLLVITKSAGFTLLVKQHLINPEFTLFEELIPQGLESIDIILLMEGKDIPSANQLREEDRFHYLPIIGLSLQGEIIHQLKTGCDVTLSFPLETKLLLAQIQASLSFIKRMSLRQVSHRQALLLNLPLLNLPIKVLSRAEGVILHSLSLGKSNTQIALLQGVSIRTIEAHVTNLLNKTHLRNRTELALWSIITTP